MAVTPSIYLDYQATTPLDPAVLDAMLPYLQGRFGNPHSVTHRFGWETEAAVDLAREQVAAVIGADPVDMIFTSGATESNNLAIKGTLAASLPHKNHLITVATEHKCVLESAAAAGRSGADITYLPVGSDGLLDMNQLAEAMTGRTALVSVMAVNNEIGVIQPLAEIGELCREKGVPFHTDAAQAFGKIPLSADDINAALMSISGHKIYGPKGIGALYVRNLKASRIVPQMDGGGQEAGIRSGTLSPALCAGLGAASVIAAERRERELAETGRNAAHFLSRLREGLPDLVINGSERARYPGNLNLTFPGADGDRLLADLRDIAMSSGAACASAMEGPSYVLQALGLDEAAASSSLRIGFGRFTTLEELEFAAGRIIEAVRKNNPATGS